MFWTLLVTPLLLLSGVLLHRAMCRRKIASALRLASPCAIVEERFVVLGGIEQWIGIRGENRSNPVLLIVHGGPGASCSIFTRRIRCWEKHFTLVQWDQRGSGKTLARTGREGTGALTIDRLAEDGIELAAFLCAHLDKRSVILVATSFGSTFGLQMARRRPDLFSAYVGTDQNVGIARDHDANHAAVIDRLRALGLKKGVAALQRIGADPSRWTPEDFTAVAQWTMKSDPSTCRMIMKLLKSAVWFSPGHTLRDIRWLAEGMKFSNERLFPEFARYDVWGQGTRFSIPFFIVQGARDVLTPANRAEGFFHDVRAPAKGMLLIHNTQYGSFRRVLAAGAVFGFPAADGIAGHQQATGIPT